MFVFFAVLGLMVSTSIVKAEDGGLKDARGDFRDAIKASREEFKTERQTFTDDLKSKREAFLAEIKAKKEEFKNLKQDAKTRFCQAANNMATVKFETAIAQLDKFQTKAGEMITTLHDAGSDTTLASESLDLSKQKLADAKTKLADVKKLIPADCTGVTPEIFGNIKLGAREAKDLLKESREALHQAIKEIKGLQDEDKPKSEDSEDAGSGTQ